MPKNNSKGSDPIKQKVRFYKTLSLILFCAIVSIGLIEAMAYVRQNYLELGLVDIDETGPYYKQIKEIIEPLRYSGLKNILDPRSGLSIDFKTREWTLHNIREFDKHGNILLKEGRYGLCGDLAIYTYRKIAPLLGDKYSVEFLRAAESNFFPLPNGSHIVLKVTDHSLRLIPKVYIIDPSYHKYQRIENFEEYIFFPEKRKLRLDLEKKQNEIFPIDNQSPIFIKKDFLIGLSVDSVDGRLDPDNFAIFLTLTKRYQYFSRTLFSIRKKSGIISQAKNEEMALKVLTKQEFESLCAKLTVFFQAIK